MLSFIFFKKSREDKTEESPVETIKNPVNFKWPYKPNDFLKRGYIGKRKTGGGDHGICDCFCLVALSGMDNKAFLLITKRSSV